MPGTGVPAAARSPASPAAPYRCPVLAASAASAECSGAEGRRCACLAARSLPAHLAGGAARPPPTPGTTAAHPAPTPPAREHPGAASPRRGTPNAVGASPGSGGFPRAGCRAHGRRETRARGSSVFIQQRGEPGGLRWGGHLGAGGVTGDPSITLLWGRRERESGVSACTLNPLPPQNSPPCHPRPPHAPWAPHPGAGRGGSRAGTAAPAGRPPPPAARRRTGR